MLSGRLGGIQSWFNLNRKVSSCSEASTWLFIESDRHPPVRLYKKKSTYLAGNSTDMLGICWTETELNVLQLFWDMNQCLRNSICLDASGEFKSVLFIRCIPQLYFKYLTKSGVKIAKSSLYIQGFAYCAGYFPLRHIFLRSGTVSCTFWADADDVGHKKTARHEQVTFLSTLESVFATLVCCSL